MRINIEIPNSFIDFGDFFPFLDCFKNIEVKKDNLLEINVSENIISNIQIVCNYLKKINRINNKDIYISGLLNEDEDEETKKKKEHNCTKAKSLS